MMTIRKKARPPLAIKRIKRTVAIKRILRLWIQRRREKKQNKMGSLKRLVPFKDLWKPANIRRWEAKKMITLNKLITIKHLLKKQKILVTCKPFLIWPQLNRNHQEIGSNSSRHKWQTGIKDCSTFHSRWMN
jgi:hypothetical protein